MSKKSKEKTSEVSWNRGRYWAATIILCALLIFSAVLVLRSSVIADQISGELNMSDYLGIWILPIAELLAAAIIGCILRLQDCGVGICLPLGSQQNREKSSEAQRDLGVCLISSEII